MSQIVNVLKRVHVCQILQGMNITCLIVPIDVLQMAEDAWLGGKIADIRKVFGFIAPSNPLPEGFIPKQVFFHFDVVQSPSVSKGDEVLFKLNLNNKSKPAAVVVKLVGSEDRSPRQDVPRRGRSAVRLPTGGGPRRAQSAARSPESGSRGRSAVRLPKGGPRRAQSAARFPTSGPKRAQTDTNALGQDTQTTEAWTTHNTRKDSGKIQKSELKQEAPYQTVTKQGKTQVKKRQRGMIEILNHGSLVE